MMSLCSSFKRKNNVKNATKNQILSSAGLGLDLGSNLRNFASNMRKSNLFD